MSDKNNGWSQPEEKFPETELKDIFAEYFSEEDEELNSEPEKKSESKKEKGQSDVRYDLL